MSGGEEEVFGVCPVTLFANNYSHVYFGVGFFWLFLLNKHNIFTTLGKKEHFHVNVINLQLNIQKQSINFVCVCLFIVMS